MNNTIISLPRPVNEPVLSYAPGTPERSALQAELKRMGSRQIEIPLIIGGKEVRTGRTAPCIEPHNHRQALAVYHRAGPAEARKAIAAAVAAQPDWERMPYQARAAIFLKAAELLSTKYRYVLNSATMLNQSKNAFQAEIDSACELADFWRFNPHYMQELFKIQPDYSHKGNWNYSEYRPLEGFVFAVTPFNFTSIGGNLPTAPAMMGNVVLWKPSSTAVLSAYYIMKILQEAGLPGGVINFIPGPSSDMADIVLGSPHFAGIHFTGSTNVFQALWTNISRNLSTYRGYPRIVGETGGKDFVFAHASADPDILVTGLVRGAYEYQGQKCSAASRAYIPASLWKVVKPKLGDTLATVKMGPPQDFSNFMNAVIDRDSLEKCRDYIHHARKSREASVLFGGHCRDDIGYFVEPTVILARAPRYRSMVEEIFAPILSIYVYRDRDFEKTLEVCNTTSPYGLTGAIFAQDRAAILAAYERLRHAAGNFYINDKPTGAVVGQQPFGGARGSGTNDKAGSILNMIRWTSARSVKENFTPPTDYRYPFMGV